MNTDNDPEDLAASRFLDIQDCESVCLALGPYRNLTTLTAATLFLHPNCQVLNHAGIRIYENPEVDFLSNYSRERFDRFVQFAIQISERGARGGYGGSIILSHAFDAQYEMKDVFEKTETGLIKKQIKCLFWKESLASSDLIRKKNVDLKNIFDQESRLRFLMPIRNPLDCALSNLKTGHASKLLGLYQSTSIIELLQTVLDEIYWFVSLKEKFPNRFFYYLEHSISREMLVELAEFLDLDPNEEWISNALHVMVVKSHYEHDINLLTFYREKITEQFSRFPALKEQLLQFT